MGGHKRRHGGLYKRYMKGMWRVYRGHGGLCKGYIRLMYAPYMVTSLLQLP